MHATAAPNPPSTPDAIPYRPMNAWFAVGRARDVGRKRPLTARLYGRELVVFRDQNGELKALDARCPHLGAHLGGGKVVDGQIECPFHAWRFTGDGDCAHVPFARKIPPKARLNCWPVVERAGLVLVWHGVDRQPPTYEVPDIEAEFGSLRHAAYFRLEGRSSVQDMLENAVDVLHFPVIHKVRGGNGFEGHGRVYDLKTDGHRMQFEMESTGLILGRETPIGWKFDIVGPTVFVARGQGLTPFDVLAFHQPTETDQVISHFLAVPRTPVSLLNRVLCPIVALRAKAEVQYDFEIWQTQRHAVRPVLSDADGPIMAYRKWMRQFYA